MDDEIVLRRIRDWQAEGLIDAALADRLRASQRGLGADAWASAELAGGGLLPTQDARATRAAPVSSPRLGLDLDAGEALAYLGAFFLIGGWVYLVVDLARGAARPEGIAGAGLLVGSLALAGLGGWASRRPQPQVRRSAGVWFLIATYLLLGGVLSLLGLAQETDSSFRTSVAGAAATAFALFIRALWPSLVAQFALLTTSSILAGGLSVTTLRLVGTPPAGDDLLAGILESALLLAWVAAAVAWFAVLTRREVADGTDGPAGRRAALTRFWMGLAAVIGTWAATRPAIGAAREIDYRTAGESYSGQGDAERLVGGGTDLVLVAVSAAVLLLGVRTGASAYLYPAGLGLIIAFSELNQRFLAPAIGNALGLAAEGLLLIAVALAVIRVRRRLVSARGELAPY